MVDFSDFEPPTTAPPPLPPSWTQPAPQPKPQPQPQFREIIQLLYAGDKVLEALSRILQEIATLTQASDVRLFLLEPKTKNLHLKGRCLLVHCLLFVSDPVISFLFIFYFFLWAHSLSC